MEKHSTWSRGMPCYSHGSEALALDITVPTSGIHIPEDFIHSLHIHSGLIPLSTMSGVSEFRSQFYKFRLETERVFYECETMLSQTINV